MKERGLFGVENDGFFSLDLPEREGGNKALPLCPAHSDFLAKGTESDFNQVEPECGQQGPLSLQL